MRSFIVFVAGIVTGMVTLPTLHAQKAPGVKLNHVGISVENFEAAVSYYQNVMGFREAFAFEDADGKPILTYLQISRDTFLEILPATADRPAGINHIGLEAEDMDAYVAGLRESGVTLTDPSISARSGARLTNATDAAGIRTELLEFGQNSLQRRLIDGWK
jgi:catechol 2,3-dioxygenase-like lactoylglutathione lyase family enzyme